MYTQHTSGYNAQTENNHALFQSSALAGLASEFSRSNFIGFHEVLIPERNFRRPFHNPVIFLYGPNLPLIWPS